MSKFTWTVAEYSPDEDEKGPVFHDQVIVEVSEDGVCLAGIILTPDQVDELVDALKKAAENARRSHADRLCR